MFEEEKSIGEHGANIYFKQFSVHDNSKKTINTYKLGTFYIVQKSKDYPVAIAELQLIWRNKNDGKKYASAKLYFDPNDVDQALIADYDDIGEDEVLEADKHVVIECEKFPYWECSSSLWGKTVGKSAYHDAPNYIERMLQSCSSKYLNDVQDLRILSFPQYCRYKACLLKLKNGLKLNGPSLLANGGLDLQNLNTIILFSRWKFTKQNITELSLTEGVKLPGFKGRPRKKQPERVHRKPLRICEDSPPKKEKPKVEKKSVVLTTPDPSNLPKIPKGSETFHEDLYAFMKKRCTPIHRVPVIGYAKINLHQLFNVVADYGGYGQVTLKKQWRTVYYHLGHSTSITNAATCTRKAYESLLLPYEKHLRRKPYIRKKHILTSEKPSQEKSIEQQAIKKNIDIAPKRLPLNDVVEKVDLTVPTTNASEQSNDQNNVVEVTLNTNGGDDGIINKVESKDAFRLMIQKRRGRPSKEFREKIERLKSMNKEVEVEIYPPLNKYQRIPAWLNGLNVGIVNPGRKRKHSIDDEQKLLRPLQPKESVQDSVLAMPSVDKQSESRKIISNVNETFRPAYMNLNTVEEKRPAIPEFQIKSIRSLAPGHVYERQEPTIKRSYIHYPNTTNIKKDAHQLNIMSSSAITVPRSILPQRNGPPRQYFSDNKTAKISLEKSEVISPRQTHHPVNNSFREREFRLKPFVQSTEVPVRTLQSMMRERNSQRPFKPSSKGAVEYETVKPYQIYAPSVERRNESTNNNYVQYKPFPSAEQYSVAQPSYLIHQPVRYNEERTAYPVQVFRPRVQRVNGSQLVERGTRDGVELTRYKTNSTPVAAAQMMERSRGSIKSTNFTKSRPDKIVIN